MKLAWTRGGLDDYLYWQKTDPKIAGAINDLIADIRRTPFAGLGKPEPLKYGLQGWWSRRITREHRLIYRVSGKIPEQKSEILQCRYRYDD
jgi:toxin YoeB